MFLTIPNTCITYRIFLIIPVTVAFTERSFSKLKLIKLYLKLTMSQKKLSGLVIFVVLINKVKAHVTTRKPKSSIEKWVLEELEYQNWISLFTSQKGRKMDFKWNILWYKNIKYILI